MKVLQVNKFLYGGTGTETVMFRTAALLRDHGHDVTFFAMQDPRNEPCAEAKYFAPHRTYSGGAGLLAQTRDAVSSIYSPRARRSLRQLLAATRPDVAHLHNVYHQLTLSVVDELAAQGIPMVMTVHDYKPVCPSYQAFTDHQPCHRCITGHPGHVIAHRCIKGSRAASAIAAAEATLTRVRRLYLRIGTFIVPSRHCGELLVQGGFPESRIKLIPNFVQPEQFRDRGTMRPPSRPSLLFVGRLEEAKGIEVLLEAARRLKGTADIAVVGDGPLRAKVEAARRAGHVRYLGRKDWSEIAPLMDEATALVMPSVWEENCPMVALEAGARACPIIASDRGGLSELIESGKDGVLVPAGDASGLAAAMATMVSEPVHAHRMGLARWARVRANHAADGYLTQLLDLYGDSVAAASV